MSASLVTRFPSCVKKTLQACRGGEISPVRHQPDRPVARDDSARGRAAAAVRSAPVPERAMSTFDHGRSRPDDTQLLLRS